MAKISKKKNNFKDPNEVKSAHKFITGIFDSSKMNYYNQENLNQNIIETFSKDKEVLLKTTEYTKALEKRFREMHQRALKVLPYTSSGAKNLIMYDVLVKSEHSNGSKDIKLLSDSKHLTFPLSKLEHHPDTFTPVEIPLNTKTSKLENELSLPPASQPEFNSGDKNSLSGANKIDNKNKTKLSPGEIPSVTQKQTDIPAVKPVFKLPNAKVSEQYSQVIESSHNSGRAIKVNDIKFSSDFGLMFNPQTQLITGTPLKDGDFIISLQWFFEDDPLSTKFTADFRMTCIPDPKSLWKIIEPESALRFRKSHQDQAIINGDGFKIVAASRRGRSHEHSGSFREDDFFISNDTESGWSVIIVSDGAGSAQFSREGSRIAVKTAGDKLVKILLGDFGSSVSSLLKNWDDGEVIHKAIGEKFYYCFHDMANLVVKAIELEANSNKAAIKDYSSTLLVAVIKHDKHNTFLATFWVGDGAIAAYGPKGTVKIMGVPDGGEYAGQTRFLDRNAVSSQSFDKRVRVGRFQDITAVMLMTDGVSDPYFETDNGLVDSKKWDVLWGDIQPKLNEPLPDKVLADWLSFFKPGHHDDRTIAVLW